MYDNIRLTIKNVFKDNLTRDKFCTRFGLSTINEKTDNRNNSSEKNLKQNLGIYLKLKNNNLTINFSLHKVYNFWKFGKQYNYNDFSFKETKEVEAELCKMFLPYFDITQAIVEKYEVGINVTTSEEPELYLTELKQINVGARILKIEPDRYYKERKQYGTNSSKDKRIVYVFYDKTFEARSKIEKADRKNVPENILRVEKDNKRIEVKFQFANLFEDDFIILTITEFKERFYDDLKYRETPLKNKNLTKTENEMLCLIFEKGYDTTKKLLKESYENKNLEKRTYYRRLEALNKANEVKSKAETKTYLHRRALELKELIISKLEKVSV